MKTLKQLMREHERVIVTQTLARNGGSYDRTAQVLGVTRRALDKILERHRLSKRRFTKPLPIPAQGKNKEIMKNG